MNAATVLRVPNGGISRACWMRSVYSTGPCRIRKLPVSGDRTRAADFVHSGRRSTASPRRMGQGKRGSPVPLLKPSTVFLENLFVRIGSQVTSCSGKAAFRRQFCRTVPSAGKKGEWMRKVSRWQACCQRSHCLKWGALGFAGIRSAGRSQSCGFFFLGHSPRPNYGSRCIMFP